MSKSEKISVLIVDDEQELLDLISMLIEEEFPNVEVKTALSGNKAISLIESGAVFDLILSDYNMIDGTGGDLYSFIKKNKLDWPFILISGGFLVDYPEFNDIELRGDAFFSKPFDEEVLFATIKQLLSLGKGECKSYLPIPKSIVLDHIDLLEKVFLKINEDKFVLIAKDTLLKEQLEVFISKGVDCFYLFKDDYKFFSVNLQKRLIDGKSSIEICDNSFKLVKEVAQTLGISPMVKEVTDKCIDSILDDLNQFADIKKRIDAFLELNSKVLSHSILTCYLGVSLIKRADWGNQKYYQSFCRASFLHDLFLSEEDFIVELKTVIDKSDPKFSIYEGHIAQCLKFIDKIWPEDQLVFELISRHHVLDNFNPIVGNLSGASLSLPSAYFIFSHHLSTSLISSRSFTIGAIQDFVRKFELRDHLSFRECVELSSTIWSK